MLYRTLKLIGAPREHILSYCQRGRLVVQQPLRECQSKLQPLRSFSPPVGLELLDKCMPPCCVSKCPVHGQCLSRGTGLLLVLSFLGVVRKDP